MSAHRLGAVRPAGHAETLICRPRAAPASSFAASCEGRDGFRGLCRTLTGGSRGA